MYSNITDFTIYDIYSWTFCKGFLTEIEFSNDIKISKICSSLTDYVAIPSADPLYGGENYEWTLKLIEAIFKKNPPFKQNFVKENQKISSPNKKDLKKSEEKVMLLNANEVKFDLKNNKSDREKLKAELFDESNKNEKKVKYVTLTKEGGENSEENEKDSKKKKGSIKENIQKVKKKKKGFFICC